MQRAGRSILVVAVATLLVAANQDLLGPFDEERSCDDIVTVF